jgi:hypothetical protein
MLQHDDSSGASRSDLDEDWSSLSSESSIDMVDMVLETTVRYGNSIYHRFFDPSINFMAPPLIVGDLDESSCISEFRFRKEHLQELANLLWPKLSLFLEGDKDKIKVKNKYTCPYETGILLVLYRFAKPRCIRPDIEKFFRMRRSRISSVIKTFVDALHEVAKPYLSDPSIFQHRFQFYADLIFDKCGAVHNVWGFIDGTLRKTCHPSHFQRLAYSGHKRVHGIKFQSVITPDGLIALLFGPVAGSRHDSFMLGQSGLLQQLQELMQNNGMEFALYGDPAYPQSLYLFGGFRNPQHGSPEANWNTTMSNVREVVEWGFKEIITQWSYLDFRACMKIFEGPVGKYYIIAAFLCNLRNCCYGGQTSAYFNCHDHNGKLNMQDYLNLVP